MEFKQTWWDNNLKNRYEDFYSWVGNSSATSKIFFRNFIKQYKFKNILDVGCGPATEFLGFKEDGINIEYMGVDSCKYLYDLNCTKGIPMILSEAESIPIIDSSYEVVFARHVLEHQPTYKKVLNELIRCASRLAVHIFFLKPSDKEHIDYDQVENFYHNIFSKAEIETDLINNNKVEKFEWIDITENENMLLIWIKK